MKQTKFVKEYISNGGNGTQAALQVYDTQDHDTAHSIAVENLQKPPIKDRIEQALVKSGVTADLITDQIKSLAVQEVDKISGDVKLKASIELLKLMGAYPGSKHTNINMNLQGQVSDLNFKDVKKELKVIDSELGNIMDEEEQTDSPITSEDSTSST